jgi:DNA-binding winged helix-turn-helix (wHTH) protein
MMEDAERFCLERLLMFGLGLRKDFGCSLTFGDYRLDLATRQLLHSTHEVRLSPKAFDLLQVLIENRPRALSKAELHDHLWPGTFVTDANLPVLVAELRRALHDDAEVPRFIRTVRRFGYACCAEISGGGGAPVATRTSWIVWSGREIPLHQGENIIGREPGVSVRLDLTSVSRRHARIVVSPTDVTVEDLGSKNGTLLGSKRVAGTMPLSDLDELQVGSARLVVRIMAPDAKTQTIAEG